MRFRLLKQTWKFLFVKEVPEHPDCLGFCDPNINTLYVLNSLKGRLRLDTCIHEMLHAALPDKSEGWVNGIATDMAKVLWEAGYRNGCETKPAAEGKKSAKGSGKR